MRLTLMMREAYKKDIIITSFHNTESIHFKEEMGVATFELDGVIPQELYNLYKEIETSEAFQKYKTQMEEMEK